MSDRMRTRWAVCAVALGMALAAAADTMSIQVRDAQMRATPSFLGRVLATCAYGDQVTVLESNGDWRKVSASAGQKTGWMHVSALSTKKITLSADTATAQTAATSDELALAGKGFNSDVEAEFKKRHQNVDFTWVDRMEKIRVTPDQMREFLAAGGVQPPAGGAQ